MVLLTLAFNARGEVNVDWFGSLGWYWGTDVNAALLTSAGSGKSTIAQLVYSSDAVADFALTGGLASSNDVVLAQLTITAGNKWGYFGLQNFTTNTHAAGYVYARIFQDNSIAVDDFYYYTTPIALLTNIAPGDAAQNIQMNTDLTYGNSINVGSNVAQVQAIPEPTTHMLFIIGGIGSWLVRSKQLAKVK